MRGDPLLDVPLDAAAFVFRQVGAEVLPVGDLPELPVHGDGLAEFLGGGVVVGVEESAQLLFRLFDVILVVEEQPVGGLNAAFHQALDGVPVLLVGLDGQEAGALVVPGHGQVVVGLAGVLAQASEFLAGALVEQALDIAAGAGGNVVGLGHLVGGVLVGGGLGPVAYVEVDEDGVLGYGGGRVRGGGLLVGG